MYKHTRPDRTNLSVADAYYLNVVKTCYVLLLQYKIALISIWHTLHTEELILKGGDRNSVISWPVPQISATARALLYI